MGNDRSNVQPGRTHELKTARTVIGRNPNCEFHLEHIPAMRQHCAITESEGKYLIEDWDSRCGTYVNGVQIAGPTVLKGGDVINVAGVKIRFHEARSDHPIVTE